MIYRPKPQYDQRVIRLMIRLMIITFLLTVFMVSHSNMFYFETSLQHTYTHVFSGTGKLFSVQLNICCSCSVTLFPA